MTEVAVLIKRAYGKEDIRREVFCGVQSIGMKEFYSANGTDFRPELRLVLADYLDYEEETLVDFNGRRYRVLRTYRSGQELELTLERAAAEDGDADG
jgi:hypothetical protein